MPVQYVALYVLPNGTPVGYSTDSCGTMSLNFERAKRYCPPDDDARLNQYWILREGFELRWKGEDFLAPNRQNPYCKDPRWQGYSMHEIEVRLIETTLVT